MKTHKIDRPITIFQCIFVILVLTIWGPSYAATYEATGSSDRAVEIARKSRDRVERNGKAIKASSQKLFKDFAERTVELQTLIDTRERLEKAGFLTRGDPDGEARRAHINGKILMQVGELKKVCDNNLNCLLRALDAFDETVVCSVVDSQATRSINTNYELTLGQYLKKERARFEQASQDAMAALESYQDATDLRQKKRFLKKYNRTKKRLIQIEQRRKLYEARVKVAVMNQKITGMIREKIKEEGNDIPARFRQVMADLYNIFAKITPIAEVGGTGSHAMMANLGFSNVADIRETLDIVDGAISKLGKVLDDMVNDVIAGLGEIKVVNYGNVTAETLSMEEEMEFLRKQREAWGS